jgi:hypothetical protein
VGGVISPVEGSASVGSVTSLGLVPLRLSGSVFSEVSKGIASPVAGGNWLGSVGVGSVPNPGRVPKSWVFTSPCPGTGGTSPSVLGTGVVVPSSSIPGSALMAGNGALGSRLWVLGAFSPVGSTESCC